MKTDAASIRIEDRICPKMVNVDNHRSQHSKIGFPRALSEKKKSGQQRQEQMQCIMYYSPYKHTAEELNRQNSTDPFLSD